MPIHAPFAEPPDELAYLGGEDHVEDTVDEEERRDFINAITEFLNHHETGKHGKDLSASAPHESEGVIEPVTLAQN